MILIVGLGNPGEKYAGHRHNVGFMAVDAIAQTHSFSPWRDKFHGTYCEGTISGPAGRQKAILLKPLTYMNDSGQSVGAIARFYKIDPEDIVVFYDELDLAPGKLRMKVGGGAAGHNGIRSIDAHIGNAFRRGRIGIGHPGDKSRVTNHVLGNFSKADHVWLDPMLDAIASEAGLLATNDQHFASAVAQRTAPLRESKKQKMPDKTDTTAKATPATPTPSTPPEPNSPKKPKVDGGPSAALGRLIGGHDKKD